MSKFSIFLLSVYLVFLSACGRGPYIQVSEVIYEGEGYMGNLVAGRSYSATHVELGIRSGNIFSLDPSSLQISFDESANFVEGIKNCNAFQAESIWYEYGLAFRFTAQENRFCPIELIGFPEDVYLDDIFEIETYIELGRQVLVLYSENQDVAIYLQ